MALISSEPRPAPILKRVEADIAVGCARARYLPRRPPSLIGANAAIAALGRLPLLKEAHHADVVAVHSLDVERRLMGRPSRFCCARPRIGSAGHCARAMRAVGGSSI